jgi:leader peptidase (prepilin peptidase)/N-methyltransferase
MLDTVFALVAGLAVGSFLNLCAYRLPRGESIVRPRSRCTSCWTVLRTRELLPVLSYLVLRGRCGHCDAPIDRREPVIELITGVSFALLAVSFSGLSFILAALVTSACILALLLIIERRAVSRGGIHRGA